MATALTKFWLIIIVTTLKSFCSAGVTTGTMHTLISLWSPGRKGGLMPASIFQQWNCTSVWSCRDWINSLQRWKGQPQHLNPAPFITPSLPYITACCSSSFCASSRRPAPARREPPRTAPAAPAPPSPAPGRHQGSFLVVSEVYRS